MLANPPTPPRCPAVRTSSKEERKRQEAEQIAAIQAQMFAPIIEQNAKLKQDIKPILYERPKYNTPEYYRDCRRGWISDEEQRHDVAVYQSRRNRARDSKHNKAPTPHRHERDRPRQSKQFCKPMSTLAARDDRLTPQAKALLQVIVARTGKGRVTDTTKTTLGMIMNRCPRSIQRYIQELMKFGYIQTQSIKSKRTGFFIGLRIWIMNAVIPYFAKENPNYDPSQWLNIFDNRRNPEETKESPTNNKYLINNILSEKKPPWFREFAYK